MTTDEFEFEFDFIEVEQQEEEKSDSKFSFKKVEVGSILEQSNQTEVEGYDFVENLTDSANNQPIISSDGTINIASIFKSMVGQRARNLTSTPFLGIYDLPILKQDYDPSSKEDPFEVRTFLCSAYNEEWVILLDCDLDKLNKVTAFSATLDRYSSPDNPINFKNPETLVPSLRKGVPVSTFYTTSSIDADIFETPVVPPDQNSSFFINSLISVHDLEKNANLTEKDFRFSAYRDLFASFNLLKVRNPGILAVTSEAYKEDVRKMRAAFLANDITSFNEALEKYYSEE